MPLYIKKILSSLLWVGVLTLWIFLALGIFVSTNAGATIQ